MCIRKAISISEGSYMHFVYKPSCSMCQGKSLPYLVKVLPVLFIAILTSIYYGTELNLMRPCTNDFYCYICFERNIYAHLHMSGFSVRYSSNTHDDVSFTMTLDSVQGNDHSPFYNHRSSMDVGWDHNKIHQLMVSKFPTDKYFFLIISTRCWLMRRERSKWK